MLSLSLYIYIFIFLYFYIFIFFYFDIFINFYILIFLYFHIFIFLYLNWDAVKEVHRAAVNWYAAARAETEEVGFSRHYGHFFVSLAWEYFVLCLCIQMFATRRSIVDLLWRLLRPKIGRGALNVEVTDSISVVNFNNFYSLYISIMKWQSLLKRNVKRASRNMASFAAPVGPLLKPPFYIVCN